MINDNASNVIIRRATLADATYVATHLRNADKLELIRCGWADFETPLRQSVEMSPFAGVALKDDVPICVFGLLPDSLIGDRARVWLLGTPLISRVKKTFIKYAHRFIEEMLGRYPILYNAVDAQNEPAKRLLQALGATFYQTVDMHGSPFLLFEIRRNK